MRHVILVAAIALYISPYISSLASGFPLDQMIALEDLKERVRQEENRQLAESLNEINSYPKFVAE